MCIFPGRVIKIGEKDKAIVTTVQHKLNEMGCGPLEEDGDFGKNTENAVKLFQARSTDNDGLPLKVDGKIGPITWAVLFGAQSVPPVTETSSPLLKRVIEVAISQIGIMEEPLGSNRGPQVDKYLQAVSLDPGNFWCAAFVYWCFDQAANVLNRTNPVIKTGGVLDHWNEAREQEIPRLSQTRATNNPALVKPGLIFIIDTGGGGGHTGLIQQSQGGKLVTIEGNSNSDGSRNGIGVFRLDKRKIGDINKGFIDYSSL